GERPFAAGGDVARFRCRPGAGWHHTRAGGTVCGGRTVHPPPAGWEGAGADRRSNTEHRRKGVGMTFEERINRLEEIAAALESDEAELAASVRLFEEGVTLVRLAAEELRV